MQHKVPVSSDQSHYPLSVVRRAALHAQGLHEATLPDTIPNSDDLYRVIEQIGCLQIDTLQMVQRSHYLALWSRVGRYDPRDLDRLAFDPNGRRLFEFWLHEACLIPLSEFRYRLPVMRHFREAGHPWSRDFLENPDHRALMAAILDRVRIDGAVRAADFEREACAAAVGGTGSRPSARSNSSTIAAN